jgi:hypothetical protein
MLDLSAIVLGGVWADVTWSVCLGLMTALSLLAWRRIHPEAMAPLQWGRDGKPIMRAGRGLAVGFTPLAATVGGLMLAAGERMSAVAEPGWMAVRLIAPLLILAAHQAHLRSALKTLKVEGGLRSKPAK